LNPAEKLKNNNLNHASPLLNKIANSFNYNPSNSNMLKRWNFRSYEDWLKWATWAKSQGIDISNYLNQNNITLTETEKQIKTMYEQQYKKDKKKMEKEEQQRNINSKLDVKTDGPAPKGHGPNEPEISTDTEIFLHENNFKSSMNSDEAIWEIKQIRKTGERAFIGECKKKCENIGKVVEAYKNNLAFNHVGSPLSAASFKGK
jgi:hypothetical protein